MATREASGAGLVEDAVPAALDAVPFGVVVLDEHQRVAYANRTAHQLLPKRAANRRGRSMGDGPAAAPRTGDDRLGRRADRADSPQIAITTLSGRLAVASAR